MMSRCALDLLEQVALRGQGGSGERLAAACTGWVFTVLIRKCKKRQLTRRLDESLPLFVVALKKNKRFHGYCQNPFP